MSAGALDRSLERNIAFVMLAALLLIFVIAMVARRPEPRWAAQYFANDSFSGVPTVRNERAELRFDWKENGPDTPVSADNFSVRFSSCLVVPRARRVSFLVTSDDAASLELDGERVVELPSSGARAAKGQELQVEAGRHSIELRVVQHGRGLVSLDASLDGRAPRPFSASELLLPGTDGCK